MKILKVICVILSCAMSMFLPGCGFFDRIKTSIKTAESEFAKMKNTNLEITKDVLKCFSEKDTKSLKALLCAKTQGMTDIDEQILAGFNLFKGRVTSFNEDLLGYEGDSTEKGIKIRLERSWNVEDIVTDAGENYEIFIHTYIIYDNDKNREGISQITITSSGGTELEIGYKWPSYFNEGRDMSYDIIEAFSEKKMDVIKSMFCAKTLKIVDIDEQIQAGLSFFEGKANMGKDKRNNMGYYRNNDYYIYVRDAEMVKNHKPIQTSITVLNENIETNAGKLYKIEFYAQLLNIGDETCKGISQIIIISDDGKKHIIGKRLD